MDSSDEDDDILGFEDDRPKSMPSRDMPLFDLGTSRMISSASDSNLCKYQRLRDISGIRGYVVNIHDATNFDIDLTINPSILYNYKDVICDTYTYSDYTLHDIGSIDPKKLPTKVGTTYRCRLRGIGVRKIVSKAQYSKSYQMCNDIKKLIDRADGWIICTISDIDIYNRILIDVIIHIPNGIINLRDFILNKSRLSSNSIFYPYSSGKYRF